MNGSLILLILAVVPMLCAPLAWALGRRGGQRAIAVMIACAAVETAALIYTAGTLPEICDSLLDSGATLSVHMYALLSEGFYTDEAYATAVVLLVLVIAINAAAGCLAKKIATR